MHPLYSIWQRTLQTAGAQANGDAVFNALINRYSEPHRHYHTLEHLTECLDWWEKTAHLAQHPAAVLLALWFHDAIYDVHRQDNEINSAILANTELEKLAIAEDTRKAVTRLILCTKHSEVPCTADEKLLVDIDLTILGASSDRFTNYETQIRAEYSHVPKWLFTIKRRAILKKFLQRTSIYSTAYFAQQFETRARTNLKSSLRIKTA